MLCDSVDLCQENAAAALIKVCAILYWLPAAGIQCLTEKTLLLGQDGWADARLGDVYESHLKLNDSRYIIDLFQAELLGKSSLIDKMQQLADEDALQLQQDLHIKKC